MYHPKKQTHNPLYPTKQQPQTTATQSHYKRNKTLQNKIIKTINRAGGIYNY